MSLSPENPGTAHTATPELNRRTVLKRASALGLLAVPAVGLLQACATGGGSTPQDQSTGGAKSADNPLGVDPSAALEVVIFSGGYGDTYATKYHVPLYEKAFPKAKVTESSTQDIQGTLQPRFTGGNPPDVVDNSGTKFMDFGALVGDDQLQDLTTLLDAPSVDDPNTKVRDTLVDGTVDVGTYNDKPYVLNYVFTVFGLWYNAKLFQSKGWTVPTTWADFTALMTKIKAAGITPYGYAGANAAYYQYYALLTSAAKIGGADILKNIDNLEDGAWTNDAVKQAAAAWAEVGKTFSDKSYLGLIHTQVQLKQDQDQLAVYPSGNWLENEMKDSTPASFNYAVMPIPSVTTSDKLDVSSLMAVAGEGFIVAAKGKNPKGGMEYLRRMLSKEGAKDFTTATGSLTSVNHASDGMQLSPGLSSSSDALSKAKTAFYFRFDQWYKDLDTECRAATNELFFQGGTADHFCQRMQAKADAIKKDSSITKFKR
ncbi:N-acetylglucosamine/diacetylchitobiose ABC transporter substrate-binding protein [Rugosimonospora acidiphila]|uniref:N-acetylglucosamine/diacetylchitobiose ABC transporter substrate-binding protein n=1 Tax=Rugosimonospora acidiphila TaxID=556531 RepID=A0ABP9S7L8_9ACTN